jgi:hypothetical protein
MEPLTLQALRSLLLWVGITGFVVSSAAYLTTRVAGDVAGRLIEAARRIGFMAGVLIVLMFTAGFCGYRIPLFDFLDSGIRATYCRLAGRGSVATGKAQQNQQADGGDATSGE